MITLRIHLVRHGEVDNPAAIRYGRLPGFSLSNRGREQADQAAQYLSQRIAGRAVVVASPLDRAQETAAIVAQRLGGAAFETDARWTEVGSALDGLPRAFSFGPYARRQAGAWFDSTAARESPLDVALRTIAAMRALRESAMAREWRDVVVVSHQHPIQYARVWTETVGLDHQPRALAAMRWRVGWVKTTRCAPASVTKIEIDSTGRCVSSDYFEPS